jgi:hypothetical protein
LKSNLQKKKKICFAAVALAHGLMDQSDLKTALLCVQLSTAAGKGPIILMEHCVTILQHTDYVQTGIGLLMLLSTWYEKPLFFLNK